MKNALVTLTRGSFYEAMALHTHPLMKTYAKSIRAEFIVISDTKVAKTARLPEKYEKLQLHGLLDTYDRILFVDTDIVILPNTPNLFDLVPIGTFAAVSEENFSGSKLEKQVTQEQLGEVDWTNVYFNSGVMVIPKEARRLFDPCAENLEHWAIGEFRKQHPTLLNDQPYLNHQINKFNFPFKELPYTFNHTRALPGSNNRFNSYMIHYSGGSGHRYGERLMQIELDCAVANSPLASILSRKLPVYRWLADRLNVAFLQYLLNKLGIGGKP